MKILFYSLHAAIWVHALPENRLVRELLKAGHDVAYLSCGRALKVHCTSMSASSLELTAPDEIKSLVCQMCENNVDLLRENGARHFQLKDFLSEADERSIDGLMQDVSRDNYLDFMFDGVEVGRLAIYELFLKYKKMSGELTPDEWGYFQAYVRNCLRSLIGFGRLHEAEKPDAVFFYSPQYAVNGVCAEFAKQRGSATYFAEGSSSNSERYEALRIWNWDKHGLVNPALVHWNSVRDLLTKTDVRRLSGHFSELLNAVSYAVYSAPLRQKFSLREHFDVPPGAKVMLATLSSFDEAYAAYVIGKFPEKKVNSPVFRDQFEWIESTLKFVEERKDIFLIVRVHPRDYPNKRENRTSEQALRWQSILEFLPANAAVNWPKDDISLYNLFGEVDAVVTGWSATGVEALVFGVPVVTYDRNLPSYPDDIHFTGASRAEYFENMLKALAVGRSSSWKVGAYRWLAVSFSLGTVRIPRPLTFDNIWPPSRGPQSLRAWVRKFLTDRRISRFDVRRRFRFRQDARIFLDLVSRGTGDLLAARLDNARPSNDAKATIEFIEDEVGKISGKRGVV